MWIGINIFVFLAIKLVWYETFSIMVGSWLSSPSRTSIKPGHYWRKLSTAIKVGTCIPWIIRIEGIDTIYDIFLTFGVKVYSSVFMRQYCFVFLCISPDIINTKKLVGALGSIPLHIIQEGHSGGPSFRRAIILTWHYSFVYSSFKWCKFWIFGEFYLLKAQI